MYKNNIRKFRTKKELTQKMLAERVDTSQQQIQRVESGAQSVRFDLAGKIAKALGENIDTIFPALKKPLAAAKKSKTLELGPYFCDPNDRESFEKEGFDMDARHWIFRVRLRNGLEKDFHISGQDKTRLRNMLDGRSYDEPIHWVCFNALDKNICLNMEYASFCHFLFEPDVPASATEENSEDLPLEVQVLFANDVAATSFRVEPDRKDLSDETVAYYEDVQLQNITSNAEFIPDAGDAWFKFVDEDGEEVFLQAKEVALITIPLESCNIDLLETMYEEEEEDV